MGLLYANSGFIPGGDQRRFRDVTMGSRDAFATERDQENGDPRSFSYIPGPTNTASGTWSGGTDMTDDFSRWVAADAMDAQIVINGSGMFNQSASGVLGHGGAQASKFGMLGGGSWDRETDGINHADEYSRSEAGWYSDDHQRDYAQWGGIAGGREEGSTQLGRVHRYPSVNEDDDGGHVDELWNKWREESVYPSPALTPGVFPNDRMAAFLSGYQGLHQYRDTGSFGSPQHGEGSGAIISVYVTSPRESARASQDTDGIAAPEGGQIRLESRMNQYTSVASGQAYFNRPTAQNQNKQLFPRVIRQQWKRGLAEDTRQLEYGSTYSPYWQARLVETPRLVLQYIDDPAFWYRRYGG